MRHSILLAGCLLLATLTSALAQSSGVTADQVWARATPGGAKTAAVYMTLSNKGGGDDRLVAVTTPAAGAAEVHTMTTENGVMRMRPAGPLDVKAGGSVVLKPGGLHVMLMDLKAPLVAGQRFPLSLTFEKAGKIDVTATVEKAGAMGPGGSMPGMPNMPGMKMNGSGG